MSSAKINNGSLNDSQALVSPYTRAYSNKFNAEKNFMWEFLHMVSGKRFQSSFIFHSSQLEIIKQFTPSCFCFKS